MRWPAVLTATLFVLLITACGSDLPDDGVTDALAAEDTPTVAVPPTPTADPGTPFLIVGDVADCEENDHQAVAALLAGLPGTIAIAGDVSQEKGTAEQYRDCVDPALGPLKARIRPVPGNHDYLTPGAKPYFDYFGAAAAERGKGWYSYEVGAWHVIAMNSNCAELRGCGPGSEQYRWLEADLAAHAPRCTLAYWHHPVLTSGLHGPDSGGMAAIWRLLYGAGVDLVIAGHDHHYERLKPADATGKPDEAFGIRSFIVGTGGGVLYPFFLPSPLASEMKNGTSNGVLSLALRADSYGWEFLPVGRGTLRDSGAGSCHGAP